MKYVFTIWEWEFLSNDWHILKFEEDGKYGIILNSCDKKDEGDTIPHTLESWLRPIGGCKDFVYNSIEELAAAHIEYLL